MMELLGQDFSYSSIVSDLNERASDAGRGPWDRGSGLQNDAAADRGRAGCCSSEGGRAGAEAFAVKGTEVF